MCHRLQNSVGFLERYGASKFCGRWIPNNRALPIAISL